MEITIFKNIKQTSTPFFKTIGVMLDRVRNGASKEVVEGIRNEKDKNYPQYASQVSLPSVRTRLF